MNTLYKKVVGMSFENFMWTLLVAFLVLMVVLTNQACKDVKLQEQINNQQQLAEKQARAAEFAAEADARNATPANAYMHFIYGDGEAAGTWAANGSLPEGQHTALRGGEWTVASEYAAGVTLFKVEPANYYGGTIYQIDAENFQHQSSYQLETAHYIDRGGNYQLRMQAAYCRFNSDKSQLFCSNHPIELEVFFEQGRAESVSFKFTGNFESELNKYREWILQVTRYYGGDASRVPQLQGLERNVVYTFPLH